MIIKLLKESFHQNTVWTVRIDVTMVNNGDLMIAIKYPALQGIGGEGVKITFKRQLGW
jgi:hypothetical protein